VIFHGYLSNGPKPKPTYLFLYQQVSRFQIVHSKSGWHGLNVRFWWR